ncbi:MAG: putative TetR-family transcriptional regulator [Pseudonocardiales bacterium]|nr:putative TetR-family transcriptional regulator [Pseudonocardiales bacterium]
MSEEAAHVVRRRYDGSRRRAAAGRARLTVIDAYRGLLLRDGYEKTTISDVAERAGLSVETIYKTFGSKKQLLKALYDATIAGDDEPVPIGSRPEMQRIFAETDPTIKIARYADFVYTYHRRVGPLVSVLAQASSEIAEIRATIETERLTGVRAFVRHLDQAGLLRDDIPAHEAADAAWALTSPMTYAQLIQVRRWSGASYRRWLSALLGSSLLGSATGPPTPER